MPQRDLTDFQNATAPVQQIFQKGEFLFEEGGSGKELYLIQEGKVALFKNTGKGKVQIGSATNGAMVGEGALVGTQTRSTSALAITVCKTLIVPPKVLGAVMDSVPSWLFCLLKTIVSNLVAVRKRADSTPLDDEEHGIISLILLLLPRYKRDYAGKLGLDYDFFLQEAMFVCKFSLQSFERLLESLAKKGIVGIGLTPVRHIIIPDLEVLKLFSEYLVLKKMQEAFREAEIPPELVATLSNIAYVAQKSGIETDEGTELCKGALIEDMADHDIVLLEKNLQELSRRNLITVLPAEGDTVLYFRKEKLSRIKKIKEWLPRFTSGQAEAV